MFKCRSISKRDLKRRRLSSGTGLFFTALTFLLVLTSTSCLAQEICDNGIDDDGDGLIDLQDPVCSCHFDVNANLLQNGSFEFYRNCPTNYSYSNDYNLIDFWQYGTYTDGNVAQYYHNFNCSYDSSLVMRYIPPSLPLPDGEAFISIRQNLYQKPRLKETDVAKAYVGQCLAKPLIPSVKYTLSFSAGKFQPNDDTGFRFKNEPFSVAVFGNPDCNAAPFGQTFANSNGCPSNYAGWILLGTTTVHSKGMWIQDKINLTVPYDINLIEIGPDCSLLTFYKDLPDSTTLLDYYVYYLDDIHLLPTKDFNFQYIDGDIGTSCKEPSVLTVQSSPNLAYQWYKDSIAIPGATASSFNIRSSDPYGSYSVRMINNIGCKVSEPFLVAANALGALKLPADTSFCDAESLTLFTKLSGISYKINGRSDSMVTIYTPGKYEIIASGQDGCSRAFNVTVHPDECSDRNVIMPNSFTPNDDGKNDIFRIPGAANMFVKSFGIFDRWGKKVFDGNATNAGWNGKLNGRSCSQGAYVYLITRTINNKLRTVRGIVFLIR